MELKKLLLFCQQKLHEIDHISLLRYSTKSSELIFCFFCVFYRNLKQKDHIKRNINSKKEMFI